MKKLLIIIVILLLNTNSNAAENIKIDNEDINEYKGKIGKWVLIDSKQSALACHNVVKN